uniref:Mitochondrial ribosomal protein L58 n=1 Tax=Leptobrachium leishanense TaxID=445787 RepID=A0A8C5WLN8_9ANUR
MAAAAARYMPLCMFKSIRSCGSRYSSSFQSVYSLNKLYPDSESPQYTEPRQEQPDIPVVNTKAEVRFHMASADWIPEDVKQKLSVQHKNRLNKDGEFIVVSDVSRYQMRNLADCLQKIRAMISDASKRPNAVPKETADFHRMRYSCKSLAMRSSKCISKGNVCGWFLKAACQHDLRKPHCIQPILSLLPATVLGMQKVPFKGLL